MKDTKNNDIVMFSINKLINIYNLIELICWNQFKENLNDQYTQFDPEQQINSHWKYDGPTSFNFEKSSCPE